MRSSAIIREAREIVTLREAWTQWALARDVAGKVVLYTSDEAVCWCAIGAVLRVKQFGNAHADAAYWLDKSAGGLFGIWQDQDGRTHDEVLNAMDRAAVLAEADGD